MSSNSSMSEYAGLGIHKPVLIMLTGRDSLADSDVLVLLRELVNEKPPDGHQAHCQGTTFDDQVQCACGWKSSVYWDGEDLAWAEWTNHLASVFGLPLPKPGFASGLFPL